MFTSRSYSKLNDHDHFLIIGQSNAVGASLWDSPETRLSKVLMFGNDYRYRTALEPTDWATNQVDIISKDSAWVPAAGQNVHSCWLRMGKNIFQNQGRRVVLIPCAKGSTVMRDSAQSSFSWDNRDATDRGTLFGSAAQRGRLAPKILKGIVIIGWESSSSTNWDGDDLLSTFLVDFKALAANFRNQLTNVPIVYAQLGPANNGAAVSPTTAEDSNHEWQRVFLGREEQRKAESQISRANMVVSFDLEVNVVDNIHLVRSSQDTLGDRMALAIRQHLYGEAVNGTGPRPLTVTKQSTTVVDVVFDKAINSHADYDNQLLVFDSITGLLTISSYARTTTDVANDTIQITLNGGTPATNTPTVTYGQTKRSASLTNHVVDTDSMPAPSFSMTAS